MLKVILRAVALILLAASIILPLAGCKSKHYHYDRGPRYAPAPRRHYKPAPPKRHHKPLPPPKKHHKPKHWR
jgi:hypothetical protein